MGTVWTGAAPSVTATLDRQEVPLGELVTLTLQFDGVSISRAPQLPNIGGLTFRGVSQSSRMEFVNGQLNRTFSFGYQFQTMREGDITIPALQFVTGNDELTTKPLALKVLPRGAASESKDEQQKDAFLQLAVSKKEVYVGESFPLEIHLYWKNGRDITTPQLKADGFSLSDNPQNSQRRTPQGFNLIVFQYVATAARAGQLTLGPAECDMTLLVPVQGGRGDPFFDSFSIFGGRHRRVPVTLKSDEVPMTVLPLPGEDVPSTFTGAVGQFQMQVQAGPTNLAVGDPITIRTAISGNGLLDRVILPEQKDWRGFQVYPPSSTVEPADPLGLSGTKRFEQVVIAQNHEVAALPPLQFSYFDPERRSYQTLRGPTFPLQVAHASQAPTPPPALTNATEQAPVPVDDIVHIKVRPEGVLAFQTPLVLSPWFLGLQAVPALAWLILWAQRRRREALASNPRLRRRLAVERRVRRGVEELRELAGQRDSDAFFATLFRLLQEQIGERLDQPASAITESVVDERLGRMGLSPDAVAALHYLFQTCNQARYAAQPTGSEMAALVPKVEEVLKELQGLKA